MAAIARLQSWGSEINMRKCMIVWFKSLFGASSGTALFSNCSWPATRHPPNASPKQPIHQCLPLAQTKGMYTPLRGSTHLYSPYFMMACIFIPISEGRPASTCLRPQCAVAIPVHRYAVGTLRAHRPEFIKHAPLHYIQTKHFTTLRGRGQGSAGKVCRMPTCPLSSAHRNHVSDSLCM